MLELPDSWTWDFWIADTGTEYHLFFLFASKALHEESRRHRRASIGHAVSTDLVDWTRLPDALVRSDSPAFDDVATWTGSCVHGDDGLWYLFYTGLSDDPAIGVQRISVATSADLMTWTKAGRPLVVADPGHYATAAGGTDEPWRDPWVFRHSDGLWHMLITARSAHDRDDLTNGVLGHATSPDLLDWTVRDPLTDPGHGFGQLEVPQAIEVDGSHLLMFSCLDTELGEARRSPGGGGVWVAPGDSATGPFDLSRAVLITDATRYAGRAVLDRAGVWQFLAFHSVEGGQFVGKLANPTPLLPLIQ
ncbi:MAG: family 43 glycosylhydrolase [Burkholderiaceae bacterium]|nr:family 43 glycosylhydrolase [Microbacteriaceae bacterium]